jgi:glycosyltransferase involved in cell wall biosynthesis
MASPFFGGPERQMLGLARSLPGSYRSVFLSFAERGRCRALLAEVRRAGLEGVELKHNFPEMRLAAAEVARHLRRVRADVVCCSGYKPDVIGWLAARQVGVPVVSVSHGWTGATLKVRCYEAVNRWLLRWMDAVVCVSEQQAQRVSRAGVPASRVAVIRNAVDIEPQQAPFDYRDRLCRLFPKPPQHVVCAAGRLSPEKGFDVLIDAAGLVCAKNRDVGFVLFGDGKLRAALERQIETLGLEGRFVLAGFHADADRYLPHTDLLVLSSHTEGLPVILLEAMAAGVAVVATAVGGVPEAVEDGVTGFLAAPGNAQALADRIVAALSDDTRRREMGRRGHERAAREFSRAGQSEKYQRLFQQITSRSARRLALSGTACLW